MSYSFCQNSPGRTRIHSAHLPIRFLETSAPRFLINSSGSLYGSMRMTLAVIPASFKIGAALSAAFRPRLIAVVGQIDLFHIPLINEACPDVSAVPSEATAFANPAWCSEITSIYPSQSRKYGFPEVRARLRPYRFRLLSKIIVSGEFRYLGFPSPITRPPNPMTRLFTSIIGNMTRFQNLSYTPLLSS